MSTDKPKPDFSNVKSGSSSTAPRPAAPLAPPEQIYTVMAGDSLSKISKKVYGDANQWKRIFEANRNQIKNPDLIHPGQKLKIPANEDLKEGLHAGSTPHGVDSSRVGHAGRLPALGDFATVPPPAPVASPAPTPSVPGQRDRARQRRSAATSA